MMLATTGCRSYWVDATIDNQTGLTVQQLEVDYHTASFGRTALATGDAMHYRFQIRGSGPVKVEYSFGDGKMIHAQGPSLAELQQGQLTIHLLPGNKVEFLPKLEPAS